jgi:hypothetical protein
MDFEKEVASLRFICKKTLQAYRIRLMCLKRRHNILESIEHNFSNISSKQKFYSQLETNLRREEKLLKIIKSDETGLESNLAYGISEIQRHTKRLNMKDSAKISSFLKDSPFKDIELTVGELKSFLINMVAFLKLTQKDLSKVESRMKLELEFLENKNSNNFKNFIGAWKSEVKANGKLLAHIKEVLRSNRKAIRVMDPMASSFSIGTGFGMGAGGVIAAGMGAPGTATSFACAFAIALLPLIVSLLKVYKDQLIQTDKDRELIKEIEKLGV